jgi:hypothetical protein
MQLHLLCQTACLTASYDSRNNWLFLDWEGELTLAAVQEAGLALAECFLHRPYPLILNSNAQVTGVSWSVATWLVTDLLPHMKLAGIDHVAWIYSPSLRGFNMVQTVLNWLPGSLITTFNDVEDAAHWLKHISAERGKSFIQQARPAATQAKLVQEVLALRHRVAMQQRKLHRELV